MLHLPQGQHEEAHAECVWGDRPAECSHCHGWHHQGEETEHVPCVDKICWEEGKEGDSFFVNFCDENFIWISCNWKKIKLSRGS